MVPVLLVRPVLPVPPVPPASVKHIHVKALCNLRGKHFPRSVGSRENTSHCTTTDVQLLQALMMKESYLSLQWNLEVLCFRCCWSLRCCLCRRCHLQPFITSSLGHRIVLRREQVTDQHSAMVL